MEIPHWYMARYVTTFLLSVAMAITYGMKVVLSMTLVKMVNHTAIFHFSSINSSNEVPPNPDLDGPFAWDTNVQSYMLSSYFGGYMVSQLPGGYMATHYSSKWVIFFCVVVNVVCCLLVPLCSYWHWGFVVILRIGKGLGGGVSFPGGHALNAHWAPKPERSLICSIAYAGTSLGTVISLLLSGLIASSSGWESVYYIFGGLSLIWCVLWVIFVADSPDKMNKLLIRKEEQDYILANVDVHGHDQSKKFPPLMSIAKSKPFWAIQICHFCANFGWYMLLIETPIYLNDVLHFKLSTNAFLVSLPYFLLWLFTIALGETLDYLKRIQKLNQTGALKLAGNFASIIPTICLSVLCISNLSKEFAVTMIIIGITFYGAMFNSWISNHISISPNYAGLLMGLTNTIGTIPGILMPLIVGAVTREHKTIQQWRIPILLSAMSLAVNILVYNLWASGEIEPFDNE